VEPKSKRVHLVLYRELSYFLGMSIMASSVGILTRVGWGTPIGASLFYVLSQWQNALTMGQWNWVIQAMALMVIVGIVREFHWWYFVSLFTSFVYGIFLDVFQGMFHFLVLESFGAKLAGFGVSFLALGFGLLLFMKSALPVTAYDLVVKEVVRVKKYRLGTVKTVFDLTILSLALITSLLAFQRPVGLGAATIMITLFTGTYMQRIDPWVSRWIVLKPLIFKEVFKLPDLDADNAPLKENLPAGLQGKEEI